MLRQQFYQCYGLFQHAFAYIVRRYTVKHAQESLDVKTLQHLLRVLTKKNTEGLYSLVILLLPVYHHRHFAGQTLQHAAPRAPLSPHAAVG